MSFNTLDVTLRLRFEIVILGAQLGFQIKDTVNITVYNLYEECCQILIEPKMAV